MSILLNPEKTYHVPKHLVTKEMISPSRRSATDSTKEENQVSGDSAYDGLWNPDPTNQPSPYLPQEILDKVFSHAISPVYDMMPPTNRPQTTCSTTLALLLTSKTTKEEVLNLIYSYSTFRYSTNFGDERVPSKALTDRMMHVEVVVDCERSLSAHGKAHLPSDSTTHIVEMFHGISIHRKTFVYYLRHCDYVVPDIRLYAYLYALNKLWGFDTVRVQHDSVQRGYGRRDLSYLDRDIKEDLELYLGPATVGSVYDTKRVPRYIECHPRQYMATFRLGGL